MNLLVLSFAIGMVKNSFSFSEMAKFDIELGEKYIKTQTRICIAYSTG